MLRSRLEGLTIDSKTRDIIFAHQNVYALTEVIKCRLEDADISPFLNYLFSQFTADESREVETARGKAAVVLERFFNLPRFKIGSDLDTKVIEMSITINEKQEIRVQPTGVLQEINRHVWKRVNHPHQEIAPAV